MFRFISLKSSIVLAALFSVNTLLVQGGALKWMRAKQESQRLLEQIALAEDQIRGINSKVAMARDPRFIEREAIEKLNLSSPTDLIFVFPE